MLASEHMRQNMAHSWLQRLRRSKEEPKGPDINKPLPIGDLRAPLPSGRKLKGVPYKRSPKEAGLIHHYRKLDPYNLRPKQM